MRKHGLLILAIMIVGATIAIIWGSELQKRSGAMRASKAPPAVRLESFQSPNYGTKVLKIYNLLQNVPTSRPSQVDADELIDEVQHDADFRIRVRAMAVFPFLEDREKAIDVLIAATHDRTSDASGGGNVPFYATSYLADMRATRGIADVADWLQFLSGNPPYDSKLTALMLKKSHEDISRLRQAAATQPAS